MRLTHARTCLRSASRCTDADGPQGLRRRQRCEHHRRHPEIRAAVCVIVGFVCDPVAPTALNHVVQRALAKDPDERWQTARDLMLELRWILDGPARGAPVVSGKARRRATVAAARGALLAAAAALGWYAGLARRAPAAESAIEFTFDAPPGTTVELGLGVALSPDGQKIAFSAGPGNGSKQLYWRSFDSPASHPSSEPKG